MKHPLKAHPFLKDFDWSLFLGVLALSAISLMEIYSSTMNTGSNSYFLRQSVWVAAGIVCLFIVASIDYHAISEHIPWIHLIGVLTLICTLALGKEVKGSRSWMSVGSFAFQPSEMIKLVAVIALARYLSELRVSQYMNVVQIAKTSIICGLPMLLVLLQGDLGTASTYLPILAVGIFVRGVRPAALVSLVLIALVVMGGSWFLLKDYQKARILTFVHPELDPQGKGYQVTQSKIAIGSGGLLGKGLFDGTQNQLGFLPTRHTDFIFSVVAEELGFIGVTMTLGLLAFVLFRSIDNARTARDNLGMFIAMGIVGIYFFHVIVNVGMVIGFMPITGIPLPFMSYGGSSTLTAFIALGLIVSVRRSRFVN